MAPERRSTKRFGPLQRVFEPGCYQALLRRTTESTEAESVLSEWYRILAIQFLSSSERLKDGN